MITVKKDRNYYPPGRNRSPGLCVVVVVVSEAVGIPVEVKRRGEHKGSDKSNEEK